MPELPEVETLVRELKTKLVNKTIKEIEVRNEKTVNPLSTRQFKARVKNKKITNLSRRAKVIVLDLNDKTHLVCHLKMTGQLIFQPKTGKIISGGHINPGEIQKDNLPNKFTRLIFTFTDNSKLYFNDLRKFGWLRHVATTEKDSLFKKTGVEPLGKSFTEKFLQAQFLKHPKKNIKQFLLDQEKIAGLGNIYVDESLFVAGINPNTKNKEISLKQTKKLHQAIKDILKMSIQKKGTTFSDYRRSDGKPGGFVPHLQVYGRVGKDCLKCKRKIKKIKVAGRGTHFCPGCQKETPIPTAVEMGAE